MFWPFGTVSSLSSLPRLARWKIKSAPVDYGLPLDAQTALGLITGYIEGAADERAREIVEASSSRAERFEAFQSRCDRARMLKPVPRREPAP